MGRSHDSGDGRSFWSAQHRQHASLLRARPAVGKRASLSLCLTGAMLRASGRLCRKGDLLAGGDCLRDGSRHFASGSMRRPSFASGAATTSSAGWFWPDRIIRLSLRSPSDSLSGVSTLGFSSSPFIGFEGHTKGPHPHRERQWKHSPAAARGAPALREENACWTMPNGRKVSIMLEELGVP